MIGARHNIKQAHDDDTNSFYFEFHLNQRINLLKLKMNLISTNKKPRYLAGLIVYLINESISTAPSS